VTAHPLNIRRAVQVARDEGCDHVLRPLIRLDRVIDGPDEVEPRGGLQVGRAVVVTSDGHIPAKGPNRQPRSRTGGDRVPAATTRKPIEKKYGARLPVSGQAPVGQTAYERRRAAKRAAKGK
jgi:hypothetical protein